MPVKLSKPTYYIHACSFQANSIVIIMKILIVFLLFTRELASISDVITIEIEHVNVAPLEELEKAGRIVQPTPATIRIIQVCTYVCILCKILLLLLISSVSSHTLNIYIYIPIY